MKAQTAQPNEGMVKKLTKNPYAVMVIAMVVLLAVIFFNPTIPASGTSSKYHVPSWNDLYGPKNNTTNSTYVNTTFNVICDLLYRTNTTNLTTGSISCIKNFNITTQPYDCICYY
jgi:hypothetical protein